MVLAAALAVLLLAAASPAPVASIALDDPAVAATAVSSHHDQVRACVRARNDVRLMSNFSVPGGLCRGVSILSPFGFPIAYAEAEHRRRREAGARAPSMRGRVHDNAHAGRAHQHRLHPTAPQVTDGPTLSLAANDLHH